MGLRPESFDFLRRGVKKLQESGQSKPSTPEEPLDGEPASEPTVTDTSQKSGGPILDRRQVMEKGAKLAAGVAATIALEKVAKATKLLDGFGEVQAAEAEAQVVTPIEPAATENLGELEPNPEESNFETVDKITAGMVMADFTRVVIIDGAIRNRALSPRTAVEMNLLSLGRIGSLALFGGEQGENLAKKEWGELMHGLELVPLLVGLSDATTTELKIDPDELLGKDMHNPEERDYTNIERPGLGNNIEAWEMHLEMTNRDLVKKVAEVAGITTALAPLGTTYTSSALANRLKQGVGRILFEQSYAKEVIKQKKKAAKLSVEQPMKPVETGEVMLTEENLQQGVLKEEEVFTQAIARTDKLMNGYAGYSKLMLTLGGNIQGGWGIGDPPEMFFYTRHKDHPMRLAKGHALGLVNSEVSTAALNTSWLALTGALNVENAITGTKEFATSQFKTLQSVYKTLTDSNLRDVSLNDGRRYAAAVEQALANQKDDKRAQELQALLKAIPKSRLQFSLRDYIGKKIAVLQDQGTDIYARVRTMPEIPFDNKAEEALASEAAFKDSEFSKDILEGVTKGNTLGVKEALRRMDKHLHNQSAEDMSAMMEKIAQDARVQVESIDQSQQVTASQETTESAEDKAAVERFQRTMNMTQNIVNELKTVGRSTRNRRLKQARAVLGLKGEETPEQVYEILSRTDKNAVADALKKMTRIPEAQVSSTEAGADGHSTQEAAEALGEQAHHESDFLSHSAKEVLWALLTQIPSVSAASRAANYIIPAAVGIEKGKRPTEDQIEKVVGATLASVVAMSAFADNVAAYLFGEEGLTQFFEETYGKDVFEKFPDLGDLVAILPLKLAEQAGALSKIGNGPNFSQKRLVFERSATNKQGLDIKEEEMTMGDTLKNGFAHVANAALLKISYGAIRKQIGHIEATLERESQQKAA